MERVDVRIGALVFVDDMAAWGNFCCDYLIKSEESWRNVRNHTARTRSHWIWCWGTLGKFGQLLTMGWGRPWQQWTKQTMRWSSRRRWTTPSPQPSRCRTTILLFLGQQRSFENESCSLEEREFEATRGRRGNTSPRIGSTNPFSQIKLTRQKLKNTEKN